ncbi:TetR/AcrR family transcriptional regulator [Myxococcota bacterium]|nr:TetR/AcrR family transcriptional regulator [Myxococcota bacterium]
MTRPRPATRRERERERHRREILDAARAAVEAHGLDGLTVEEVARRSEFAVGSIYRYFRSKEDLVDMLLMELAAPYLDDVDAALAAERPFEQAFDGFLDVLVRHASEDLPALQLLYAVPGTAGTETRQRVREAAQRHFAAVGALVERGQAEGALAGEEPEAMTIALVGMLAAFIRPAVYGFETDFTRAAAVVRRGFLRGFGA